MARTPAKNKKDASTPVPVVSDTPRSENVRKVVVEAEDETVAESPQPESQSDAAKDFGALYRHAREGLSDLTKITRGTSHRRAKVIGIIVAIFLVLAGAALAGFFFFVNRQPAFDGTKVVLALSAGSSVASGEQSTFSVAVQNNEEVDLREVELTLQLPDGFTFSESTPQPINDAHNAWQVGTIKSGGSKTVTISGQFFGEVGSVEQIGAVASFYPENFNSQFQSTNTFSISISESILGVTVQTPVKVVSGRSGKYEVEVANHSKKDVRRVRLTITSPAEVQLSFFNPEPTAAVGYVWDFDVLKAGEQTKVAFQGVVAGSEGEMREMTVEVGYTDDAGQYHVQVQEKPILFVVNPQLLLALALNGSTGQPNLALGDVLTFSVKYQNASQFEVKNLVLQLALQSKALDWNGLADPQHGTIDGGKITWDAKVVPQFAVLAPGAEGELTFTIPVLATLTPSKASEGNFSIEAKANATSDQVPDLDGTALKVESNVVTAKINSHVDLRVEGRYYSDEHVAVGSGPIPPQVGQETTYQVYWYLKNGANEVRTVSVASVLPAGVRWVSSTTVSAGTIRYDESSRTVTWTINKLPMYVGTFLPEVQARFALAMTPTDADLGQLLILAEKTDLSATDAFTAKQLQVSRDHVTSDLATDPEAAGQGIVVAPPADSNVNTNSNSNANTNGL